MPSESFDSLDGKPISRRRFLALAVAGTASLGTPEALYLNSDTQSVDLKRVTIPIPALAPALVGFKIAFLSDIHRGIFVPAEWLRSAIARLKGEQPDLLLLGGDYIWLPERPPGLVASRYQRAEIPRKANYSEVVGEIFDEVAGLVSACHPTYGTFGVRGNHDCWTGPAQCVASFQGAGIQILVNEHHVIDLGSARLEIVGVDDYTTSIPQLPARYIRGATTQISTQGEETQVVKLLLSHNPDYVSALQDRGLLDQFHLTLAGHTHGGQVKLPGIGALWYNTWDSRFREGLAPHAGGYVYTSRGLGVSKLPFRVGCPPEINVFELVRA